MTYRDASGLFRGGRRYCLAFDSPLAVFYASRTERLRPFGSAGAPAAEAGGPAGRGLQRNSEDTP